MGGAPPKSCLGGGLGGILGGVGGDLGGGFGRILLYCSLSTKYFVLRGKLYINWNLMLWTSKLINAISLSEKYFFVLGSFSWKICEHGFFFASSYRDNLYITKKLMLCALKLIKTIVLSEQYFSSFKHFLHKKSLT